jgi:glycosyltransferase involved in cell wall biosynthesis
MRLLIITSEYLYEGYTLGATFELSQAHILAEKYDVSILSVSAPDSLSAAVKALLRNVFSDKKANQTGGLLKRVLNIAGMVLFKRKAVVTCKIESIPVYEGIAAALVSLGGFKKQLDTWVNAGLNAFDAYRADNGQPAIIHAHGRFLNAGVLAHAIKKKYGIPYVYTDHSTFYQQGIAPAEARPYLREVIDESNTYITVSEALEKQITRYLLGSVKKATIIPNVIDPIFESPLLLAEKKKHFTFITIAALEYKKGHDILINAFAKAFKNNPGYRLIVVGEGPMKAELIKLAENHNAGETIQFTGGKSKTEILELLDNADVMVLASRVETFGVVLIEALSRGLPVIGTRSGGPEYIIQEHCGILIEPEDEMALTVALTRLATTKHLFNRSLIRNTALQQYGGRTFLTQMETIYNYKAV